MKKKLLVFVTAAALAASQGSYVFAAPSPGTGSTVNTGGSVTNNGDNQDPERHGSSSSSGSSASSSASAGSQSNAISGAEVGTDSVKVNAGASAGSAAGGGSGTVTINDRGQAVIGDAALEFAKGDAATAGLPGDVKASISEINNGGNLNNAVRGVDLSGYAALTQSNALVIKDAATNQVAVKNVRTPLYVPNLTSNLKDVMVLVYDNGTNQWRLVRPAQIDYAAKTIYVDFAGSCTVIPVHRVG